jgi:hypothetical protein
MVALAQAEGGNIMVLGLLLVLNLIATVILARAVGTVALNLNQLWKLSIEGFEQNLDEHRLTRSYVGKSLLEERVLPTIGYREPPLSPSQKWMKAVWMKEVEGVEQCQS